MKLNWKTVKITLAFVIVIGAIFWAVNAVRSLSYSGASLTFPVGYGAVTVTNPSNQPVAVQLVSAGSRSFSVSSAIEGLSGSSTTQQTGTVTSQLVEFVLPPGVSEFTVVRGKNVTTEVDFVANNEIKLEAAAQPLNTNDTRTTIIVAVVVVFGALFYISRTTGIRWISASRRKEESDQAAGQLAERQAFKRRFRRVTSEKE
jgi:preprotein translocase subunit SecE